MMSSAMIFMAMLMLVPGFDAAQSACKVGSTYHATMGHQQRWPSPNPALVAPVQVNYSYPKITYPLEGEFTGESIALTIPGSYDGGFVLSSPTDDCDWNTSTDNCFEQEQYRLARIEVRKAGQSGEGVLQALDHTLEAVLIHSQVGGSYWASVVVPFVVSNNPKFDPMFPIITGATMPTTEGQREAFVRSSAQDLDLAKFFGASTFLQYWTKLPTNCVGIEANTRQFMRSEALNLGYDTYKALLESLEHAPDTAPDTAQESAWLVNSCSVGGCTEVTAQDVSDELTSALDVESQATIELRERKTAMDTAYSDLLNGSASNATNDLSSAMDARQNLESADAEFQSASANVAELEHYYNQTQSVTFDSQKPAQKSTVVESLTNSSSTVASFAQTIDAGGASVPILITAAEAVDSGTVRDSNGAAIQASGVSSLLDVEDSSRQTDCSAFRKSPVDISSKRAIDPGSVSLELRERLQFLLGTAAMAPKLQVAASKGRLRITSSDQEAFGSLVVGSTEREISYMDIVVPGEHAIDGVVGDAEVQLVHAPLAGGDATAIAFRLEMGAHANTWVSGLIQQKNLRAGAAVVGQPLGKLHQGIGTGVQRFFRYDGTLTTTPCTKAQWLVVDEPGHISKRQFASLLRRVGGVASDGTLIMSVVKPRKRFSAGLVAFGTTRLASQMFTAPQQDTTIVLAQRRQTLSVGNLRKRRVIEM